jgi:hypothetical protein
MEEGVTAGGRRRPDGWGPPVSERERGEWERIGPRQVGRGELGRAGGRKRERERGREELGRAGKERGRDGSGELSFFFVSLTGCYNFARDLVANLFRAKTEWRPCERRSLFFGSYHIRKS